MEKKSFMEIVLCEQQSKMIDCEVRNMLMNGNTILLLTFNV